MTTKDYWIIANSLRKVRSTWGLTDNVNTRDEALFNDVVDSISRALGKDNSRFSPERFSEAIYGLAGSAETNLAPMLDFVSDEQRIAEGPFFENSSPE